MGLPEQPVTLSAEQIAELNKKLSDMRHDINNNLSMIMASAELMRIKPDIAVTTIPKLLDQPDKIKQTIGAFSSEFEKILGITRQ
jgi:hypothetical protein